MAGTVCFSLGSSRLVGRRISALSSSGALNREKAVAGRGGATMNLPLPRAGDESAALSAETGMFSLQRTISAGLCEAQW